MSRITSYFLQQKVNLSDQREVTAWLTRFKELDLRLVHWKMLLPQKWKTHMERQTIVMDPNLTTAHLTHNASMILLHQLIAYPPPSWLFRDRLPSAWSAETCYLAGIEIARIVKNYLTNSNDGSPVGNQLAFCLFIAGRMLIIHWKYETGNELPDEFWSLVRSLEEMSRRWNGRLDSPPQQQDLSTKYAVSLKNLYELCASDDSVRLNVMDYTREISHHPRSRNRSRSQDFVPTPRPIPAQYSTKWPCDPSAMPDVVPGMNATVPFSPHSVLGTNLPASLTINTPGAQTVQNGLESGDFTNIPQMMLDHHFINMDRVITFDDGSMFAATLEHNAW